MFCASFKALLQKSLAVDSECAAGFHARCVGTAHNQAVRLTKFLLQKTDSVFKTVAAEGIGTDKFGELIIKMMRRSTLFRLHLIKCDMKPPLRKLPRGFGTGKAGSND